MVLSLVVLFVCRGNKTVDKSTIITMQTVSTKNSNHFNELLYLHNN